MKLLVKYIHLFANGEFKVLCNNRVGSLIDGGQIIDLTMQSYCTFVKNHESAFTLIARPYSDMTGKERDRWVEECKKSNKYGMLYLLSIGCLPLIFDDCFNDGTVIDSTKL